MAKRLGGLTPALPKLPSIPTFGGRRKREEQPRPKVAKALRLGTERRKRPRITIEELSTKGAAALKERGFQPGKLDRRSAITKVLDLIDVPRNVIANAVGRVVGVKTGNLRKSTILPKVFFSDILKELGVKKGPGRAVAGFVGDVGLDPLTYLSFGSTTGVQLSKALPRVLKPGVKILRQAAKTGQIPASIATALKTTPQKFARTFGQLAARVGPKRAAKQLFGRRGGLLAKRLVSQARKGAPDALQFFVDFGEKGRSLFRLPFAKAGFPILKVGARARKARAAEISLEAAKALKAGVTPAVPAVAAEARRLATLAKEPARIARLTRRAQAGEAARRGVLRQAGQRIEDIAGAAQVEPPPGALLQQLRPQQPLLTRLKGQRRRIGAAAQEATERLRLARAPGTQAPGVISEFQRAEQGATLLRGAPGPLNVLRRAKQALFGPSDSTFRQRLSGVQNRLDRAGPSAKAADQLFGSQVDALVPRLAQQTGRSADDLKAAMFNMSELGGNPQNVGLFGPDDVIRQSTANNLPLFADDPTRQLIDDYAGFQTGARRVIKGEGFDIGKQIGPRRVATPEARQQLRLVAGQQGVQPVASERAFLRLFQHPDGRVERVLTRSVAEDAKVAELTREGFAETGKELVSAGQWNEWAKLPTEQRPAFLGPDFEGLKEFKGDQFQLDLAKSAGAEAGRVEKIRANAMLRDLVQTHGVDKPVGAKATDPRFQAFAPVNKPAANSPFAPLAETGLFDKVYPVQIADGINQMTAVWDSPQAIQSLVGATDRYLTFWKTMQLFHPAYVIRNVFQNFFGGLMAGANPAAVAKLSMDRNTKLLRQALVTDDAAGLAGRTMDLHGRDVPLQSLFNFSKDEAMAGVSRTAQEVGQPSARRLAQGTYGMVFKANTFVEDTQRLATWLHFLDTGMDARSALTQTLKAMPDLSDLTKWERNIGKRVFPFWSWMRKNGALQLFEFLPNKPAFMANMPRFSTFVENFLLKDTVPDDLRPMWQQEAGAVQITGGAEEGTTILGGTFLPFEEVLQAGQLAIGEPEEALRRGVSSVRPELKAAAEFATQQNIFRRQPVEKIRDVGPRRLLGALAGRSGTALDSLLGLRPIREATRLRDIGVQQPVTFGLRAGLGGALQPVEAERGVRSLAIELDQQQRSLRLGINRAIQAQDQALEQNLFEQWFQTMLQMWRRGFPVPQDLSATFQREGIAQDLVETQ